MRLSGLLSALVVAAVLRSAVALGQPVPTPPFTPPSDQDAKEAKRHFLVGNDLYRDGRFQDAVVEFDASYRLGGRASALRNGADCRRQLNEYADAYDAYQTLLARHGAELRAPDKAAVQQAIDELDSLTGLLSITSSENAEVSIDGRVVGGTPLAVKLRLSVGRHKLVLRAPGFVPFQPSDDLVIVSRGAIEVRATLVREVVTGHLSVREEGGRDVHVWVDGVDEGPAPWEGDLPPGPHKVEAKGARFAAPTDTVTLERGQSLDVMLTASSTIGRLRVTTLPESAAIEVDGQAVGRGSWEGDVAPGSHHVVVTEGAERAVRDVVVERGATVLQEIPLSVPVEAPPSYAGWYGRLSTLFFVPLSNYAHANAVPGVVNVNPSNEIGLGGTLRVGYAFGAYSIELATAFVFAGRSDSYGYVNTGNSNQSSSYDLKFNNVNGFVAPGVRLTTPGQGFRFTAGVALGVAIRNFSVDRSSGGQNGDTGFNSEAGYVDPAVLFDLGFLLGGTPGLKFHFGAVLWADFPHQDVIVGPDTSPLLPDRFFTARGRGYLLASGGQVFFGPTLGLQFGH